jgi:sulfur carrier protein
MTIDVTVNQKQHQISYGTNLNQLIKIFSLPQLGSVVAVNDRIVQKDRWDDTLLNDGDQISIFQVIAGG